MPLDQPFTCRRPSIFLRVHDPKTFGDDISARRTTVVDGEPDRQSRSSVSSTARDTLGIFAMTPIVRDGKSLAVVDIGVSLRQGIRRPCQAALRCRSRRALVRRQSLQDALLDLRRSRGRDPGRVEERASTARRCSATPPSTAIRPRSISARSRTTPASRSRCSRSIKDTTAYEAAAAEFAAQPHPRHRRHPGGRGSAGVPARPRPVAAAGRDHRGDEPALQRRYRCHHPRRRPQGRTRHHGGGRRCVPPQHDRGQFAARGAGSRQDSSPKRRRRRCNARWPTASRADVKSVVGAVAQATKDMQRVAGEITTSVNGTSDAPPRRPRASDEASASVNTVAAATEELASSVAEIGRQVTHSSHVADGAVAKAAQTTEWSAA